MDNIKNLCKKYGVRPSREFGQNFLIDREVLEEIVAAADLKKDDVVLEIGPGFGVLTSELVARVKKVVAVEADRKLAKTLKEIIGSPKNLEVAEGDVLKFNVSDLSFKNYEYKIVANLPYQITSAMLRKFLENEPRPSEITVMVQKEVAERISGEEGSVLSLSVKFYGRPEIVATVPSGAFWPEPEVDSAILKISEIKKETEKNIKRIDPKDFFRIVKIGFSSRRKQLHNNLSGGLRLPADKINETLLKFGLDPKIRAEDLSLDNWIDLAKALAG